MRPGSVDDESAGEPAQHSQPAQHGQPDPAWQFEGTAPLEGAGQFGPVRHRRPRRWQRLAVRILVIALFNCGAGAGAAEAYVDSVPLPGAPTAPQASVLYYSDGHTILARVGTTDHSDVPLSAVPLPVRQAVLAAEDRGFYSHAGVSARGVARAFVADIGGSRQGASTVTQQWARNAFLTQDFSVDRKIREFALAVKIERQYTKDQILEHYLNTIYFGRGAYGIAAAAHAYFGITTDRLTPAQGAVLAATIKDPYRYDPAVDAAAAKERWTWIVNAEKTEKWLSGNVVYPQIAPADPSIAGPNGLVVDQVEKELASHGITSQELHTRGLSVVTTLDATAQSSAATLVAQQLNTQPKGLQAALVALDPQTGGVRAYYGGDMGPGYYDYAATTHPAASTFKPIVLAAAEQEGIGYQSRWDGSSPRTFPDRLGVPLKNNDNQQCPDCTLESAMVGSLNTPFYAVSEQIGADKVRDMAVNLGIPEKYDGVESMVDHKGDPTPGKTRSDIAIGRYPVAPADLASVYATFADDGVRHDRFFVESARDADNRALWTAAPQGKTVLPSAVAADVSTVLSAVVKGDKVVPGRPAAGKTGTQQWGNSNDNQDAWMAGYTPDLAAAVWLGKAVPGPIRDDNGKPIEGETVPATLWKNFLQASLNGQPKTSLPKPAHVGRTDVGDAGKVHDDGTNPDQVSNLLAADPGYAPVIHTAHTGKRLALTFDDGPSDYTPQVLDLLKQYNIKATFCMVGENATWYPATVRRIVADGHALCDHSMHHDDLGVMSPEKSGADIKENLAAIDAAAPGATVTYYRAPYGDFGPSAKVAAGMGLTPLGWMVDPDDWTLPGVNAIVSRIEAQIVPRAVVLVHDGGGNRQQTVDALKILIPKLLADGWTFDLPQVTQKAHPLPSASPSSPSASESSEPTPESTATSTTPTDGATKPGDGGTTGDDPTGGTPAPADTTGDGSGGGKLTGTGSASDDSSSGR
jgi:membrane peptidoglycan carboxypeptidase